jgi:hypothetical protein
VERSSDPHNSLHSLRAAVFFPDELPDIDMDDKDSVNMIKKDFPEIRAKAKAPSFSLTCSDLA